MASETMRALLRRKPTEQLIADTESEEGLNRSVTALDLTALGIGAIIGTGIFVIIGEAIGDSGPSIILSYVLAGVTCVFSEIAKLVNIGTLFAFLIVNIGVVVSARRSPSSIGSSVCRSCRPSRSSARCCACT